MPRISDGEPLDISFEVEGSGGVRTRTSNIAKLTIEITGTPRPTFATPRPCCRRLKQFTGKETSRRFKLAKSGMSSSKLTA